MEAVKIISYGSNKNNSTKELYHIKNKKERIKFFL